MERLLFLDTETTGLDPKDGHRIIEIGVVEVFDRRLTGNHFHAFCNPEREIEAAALAVHGLTPAFLADKPLFSDIALAFLQFLNEKPARILAHNASFDLGFVNAELAKAGLPPLALPVEDTLVLARQRFPGQRHSLDALCKRLHVDNRSREKHGALLDAELLAQVYLAMTRGQESFFALLEMQEETVTLPLSVLSKPLPLLDVCEEELVAHRSFLAEVAKISGKAMREW
jgi:DNA polymerase-3 subunit epsilon